MAGQGYAIQWYLVMNRAAVELLPASLPPCSTYSREYGCLTRLMNLMTPTMLLFAPRQSTRHTVDREVFAVSGVINILRAFEAV